jgi:hypothetical protein
MNQSYVNLKDFIHDFELKKPNGITHFNATIIFNSISAEEKKSTEVQIITSDHLSCIYFLNPEFSLHNLPDMLDVTKNTFIYIKNECLKIENNHYTILIFPKTIIT